MILVFNTSTGEPITAATNPAIEDEKRWQATLSFMSLFSSRIYLTWSNLHCLKDVISLNNNIYFTLLTQLH